MWMNVGPVRQRGLNVLIEVLSNIKLYLHNIIQQKSIQNSVMTIVTKLSGIMNPTRLHVKRRATRSKPMRLIWFIEESGLNARSLRRPLHSPGAHPFSHLFSIPYVHSHFFQKITFFFLIIAFFVKFYFFIIYSLLEFSRTDLLPM